MTYRPKAKLRKPGASSLRERPESGCRAKREQRCSIRAMNCGAATGSSRAMKLPMSARSRSALSANRSCATVQVAGKRLLSRTKTSIPSLTRPAARSSRPACSSFRNASSFSASLSSGSTVTAKRASAAGGSGNRSRMHFGSTDAGTTMVNGSSVFADLDATTGSPYHNVANTCCHYGDSATKKPGRLASPAFLSGLLPRRGYCRSSWKISSLMRSF